MHRRPVREPDGRDGRDRFTAEAVTRAADALPVNDILRAVSRTEQELLRLVLLVPESHDGILDGLDEESRALGQALVSRPGPNPRELGDHALGYEIERLTLELDDAEWQDRAAWNRDAMGEAERDDDRELIDRLSNE